MRKFIAMLLTVTLLVTGYGSCFADRVKLPASLLSIEKETFYGDTSVKEVVVPYGTQYIMARAFAYSGLEKIYIPDTVTFIASNAFEGLDDLWIIAEEDTYAYNFALEYDYYWKDANSYYGPEKMGSILDVMKTLDVTDFKPVSREGVIPEKLPLYDTEDVYDEEDMAVIKNANSHIAEYNRTVDEFTNSIDETQKAMEGIIDLIETVNISESSGNTTINCDGINYKISGINSVNLDEDCQLADSSVSEDGSVVKLELNSQGRSVYYTIDATGLYISSSSANKMMTQQKKAKVVSNDAAGISNKLKKLKIHMDKLNKWVENTKPSLAENEKKAEELVEKSKESMKVHEERKKLWEKRKEMPPWNHDEGSKARAQKQIDKEIGRYNNAKNEHEKALKNHKEIKAAKGISAALTIADDVRSLVDYYNKGMGAYGLTQHNHPTDIEAVTPELKKYAEIVRSGSNGELIICCFFAAVSLGQIIMKVKDVVLGFRAIGGIPAILAGQVADLALSKVAELTKEYFEEELKKYLKQYAINSPIDEAHDFLHKQAYEADAHLHGYIVGYVTDEVTGQKLKAVAVMMDGRLVYTNANGYYEMMSGVGTEQLLFKKEWYVDKPLTVNVEAATSYRRDVQLKPKGKLSGTAKDATTGAPLSGVRVTCGGYQTFTNSQGFYNFNLEESGSVTVRFEKEGYIPYEDHASVSPGMTTPVDAPMSRELEEDEYRVVLSWGSTPADLDSHLYQSGGYHIWYSHRSATNANLDLDDTNGYGPETTTFKIDTVSTYTYYVHDFTNKGSTNTGALGRSGAKVVVYRGNKILGTYYVPSGGGTAWKVFTITQGEFKVAGTIGYYSLAS